MVRGVEIGGDVFEIPSQIDIEHRVDLLHHNAARLVLPVAPDHAGGDPEPLQGGVGGGRLALPHDDLEIRPGGVGRPDHERGGLVVLAMQGVAALVRHVERHMDREFVPGRDRPLRVERERHLRCAGKIERDPLPLNHTSDRIAPFGFQEPTSGDRPLEVIAGLDRLRSLHRVRHYEAVGEGATNGEAGHREDQDSSQSDQPDPKTSRPPRGVPGH